MELGHSGHSRYPKIGQVDGNHQVDDNQETTAASTQGLQGLA